MVRCSFFIAGYGKKKKKQPQKTSTFASRSPVEKWDLFNSFRKIVLSENGPVSGELVWLLERNMKMNLSPLWRGAISECISFGRVGLHRAQTWLQQRVPLTPSKSSFQHQGQRSNSSVEVLNFTLQAVLIMTNTEELFKHVKKKKKKDLGFYCDGNKRGGKNS